MPARRRFDVRGGRATGWAPLAVLVLGLVVNGGILLNEARRLWFWRDDWVFLLPGARFSVWGVLVRNYNGHWSTWPWLWFRLLVHVFGLRHYLPYAVAPVLLHVAACVLLYVLARRSHIGAWPAALATLVIAFLSCGAGAQDPLWAFQVGFLGSCVLGLVGLLLADLGGRWRWFAPLALLLAVMCSNVGLIMMVLFAGWALVRLGLRRAVAMVAGPAVIYVAWYLGYGHTATEPLHPGHGAVRTLSGLRSLWSQATGITGVGVVILVVLVVGVLLVRRDRGVVAFGAGGLLALVFAYVLFGFGKSADPGMPTESRYAYVGILVCAPALACLFHAVAVRGRALSWGGGLAGALVLVLAGVAGVSQTISTASALRAQTTELRGRVVATRWLIGHDATFLDTQIWPGAGVNRPVTVNAISRGEADGLFRPARPSAHWLFETRAQLQVGVQSTPFSLPAAERVSHPGFTPSRSSAASSGCTEFVAGRPRHLDVFLGANGGQVQLRFPGASEGSTIWTQLVDGGRTSEKRAWLLTSAAPVYVGGSTHGGQVRVYLPRGTVSVCRI